MGGGGGHYGSPPNFVVSSLIMTKFGVLVEFDKITIKKIQNDVTAEL